jgi:putative methionine-R-sulfoxide reductase with GAF domain
VPIFDDSRNVIAVLDIDSEHLAMFDKTDKVWLEKIVKFL